MDVVIDKSSDIPLYVQIRDRVVTLIEQGELQPGDRLPPVTAMAKEIGVTQATIRRAFEDLTALGHTQCHVGRGTFIKAPSQNSTESIIPAPSGKRRKTSEPVTGAAQKLRNTMSKALHDIMALADRPNIIKLLAGVPDPSLLPDSLIEQQLTELMVKKPGVLLDTSDPLGDLQLRSEVAKRMNCAGGRIGPENVLIINGSIQACALLGQKAIGTDGSILFETPCYTGMANSFGASGHWVNTVPRDEEGPDMTVLTKYNSDAPALFYLCPYVHNPMGTNLSRKRASALGQWAKATGCTLIADEIFRDLNFTKDYPPSLLTQVGLDHVITISSLSKSISPGLRIGWIVGSEAKIGELSRLKRTMDYAAPPLMQQLVTRLFTTGAYDEHTEKMRMVYKSRMVHMLDLLEKHMPDEVTWTSPDGGFSLLVSLPPGYSSIGLFLCAVEKGVAFLPGPLFDPDQRFVNCFRLSCAWAGHEEIQEGIELLADAVTETLTTPGGSFGLNGLGNFQ